MLGEFEQLSYTEIAELLRLPVNTVRSRLFRSRMALKNHLEPQRQEREQSSEHLAAGGELKTVKFTGAEGESI
jgi:hypothetical protein